MMETHAGIGSFRRYFDAGVADLPKFVPRPERHRTRAHPVRTERRSSRSSPRGSFGLLGLHLETVTDGWKAVTGILPLHPEQTAMDAERARRREHRKNPGPRASLLAVMRQRVRKLAGSANVARAIRRRSSAVGESDQELPMPLGSRPSRPQRGGKDVCRSATRLQKRPPSSPTRACRGDRRV